jgi:hypothetical protein
LYLIGALPLNPRLILSKGVPPIINIKQKKFKETFDFILLKREVSDNGSDGIYVVLNLQADQAEERADQARRQARSSLL